MQRPGVDDLIEAIQAAGVRDGRVLDAFRATPRAGFVPGDLVARAYVDTPLAIAHAQVTTQPSLVAVMVEALALRGSERVRWPGKEIHYRMHPANIGCLSAAPADARPAGDRIID